MPLTDSKHRTATPKKRQGELGWYPDSTKMDCIKLWLITGNLAVVSATYNIPYKTLQTWRYSDWWAQMSEEIRTEGHIQLSNKLKSIAEKALEVTLDRLEKGDWIWDQKKGEMIRKPVVMRDAHRVAESLIDRGLKIQSKPIEEMNNQKIQDRLQALASTFADFAKKTRKVEVLDAVQIESPSSMDVLSETENGEEMGERDTFDQGVTQEEGEVNAR